MSNLSALFLSVKLPVMPEVAHALIRTLHDEEASVANVRNIMAKDPTLTAKVLRAANSAGFGLRREVNSLDNAISLVGMSQVRTLALSACMNVAFPVIDGLDRTAFWKNCMACAGFSQWLAGQAVQDVQLAWLGGMMVRLGELLMVQHSPDILSEIERQPNIPGERWKRETKLFGFSEAQVTAELARRWHFPAPLIHGLEGASDPLKTKPFCPLGGVIHLAGWLAEMPLSQPIMIDAIPQDVLIALGVNPESLRDSIPQPDSFFDMTDL